MGITRAAAPWALAGSAVQVSNMCKACEVLRCCDWLGSLRDHLHPSVSMSRGSWTSHRAAKLLLFVTRFLEMSRRGDGGGDSGAGILGPRSRPWPGPLCREPIRSAGNSECGKCRDQGLLARAAGPELTSSLSWLKICFLTSAKFSSHISQFLNSGATETDVQFQDCLLHWIESCKVECSRLLSRFFPCGIGWLPRWLSTA